VRAVKAKLETILAEANKLEKQIGVLMKSGKKEEAESLKAQTATLKSEAKQLEESTKQLEEDLFQKLVTLPNTPHASVPQGKTADDNEVVSQSGSIPQLMDGALPHWDIITKYNLIDFELGNKITGAGFPVYRGKGARLQRGLVNFFLDEALKAGYEEIVPPFLVNADSGFGTGQLPDKEGQMYHAQTDDLYLIPTAEVPITNIYRDVILKEDELPIKNVGYSPCFRREAGSWGAHVRGLNRLHQFEKVEIVQIATPEQSYAILEEMVKHVQGLLEKLELPYRILRLCGGDMGFTSALTYDFETYSAAQQRWLEVSSTSNFESFQANRLKCRFKNKEGKNQLVHTLNGSALALPRILATILENNQTPDGIRIPKVLVPYVGFDIIN
ncbi:MAG: serine--tRNA ligase, partial [Bacteroidota bacterium]